MTALTDEVVRAVLKRARGRKVQYLCRAYLQFGPEAMDTADLEALTAAAVRSKTVQP